MATASLRLPRACQPQSDPLAAFVESKESAVDEDPQRPSVAHFPVLPQHLLARGLEPCAILDADAMTWAPLKPIGTVKHWVGLPQLNDRASEGKEVLVHARPVQPRDFVVLAICVVVASLSPSEFVPGNQQNWHTLRPERSGVGLRSGELTESPVVASLPFYCLSLYLLPAS